MPLPRLTLLASLDPLVRERAVAAACAGDPDLLVLRHELTTLAIDGLVHRLTEADGRTRDVPLPVDASCCLSCLLREDTEQALATTHHDEILLVLPPSVEPAAVALALADARVAQPAGIAVAVDASALELRLYDEGAVADLDGLDDDPRTIGEVAARSLEQADLVLHDPPDPRAAALLDALSFGAPAAAVETPAWAKRCRHDPEGLAARQLPGVPPRHLDVAQAGVDQRRWHRRRPLHPQRLLEVLDSEDLHGLARARGWLWVATRPDTALELDSCTGRHDLGAVDAWVDALTADHRIDPRRQAQASRRWHPYYGDRTQDLSLLALDRDVTEIMRLLDECLLTDTELAAGPDRWRGWPDPFTPWLGEEAELLRSIEGGQR